MDPDAEILQKWSYTILDPDTSGPKDPDTETLHKWSYSILIEVVQRILIQRSSANGPTGSRYKWSKRS